MRRGPEDPFFPAGVKPLDEKELAEVEKKLKRQKATEDNYTDGFATQYKQLSSDVEALWQAFYHRRFLLDSTEWESESDYYLSRFRLVLKKDSRYERAIRQPGKGQTPLFSIFSVEMTDYTSHLMTLTETGRKVACKREKAFRNTLRDAIGSYRELREENGRALGIKLKMWADYQLQSKLLGNATQRFRSEHSVLEDIQTLIDSYEGQLFEPGRMPDYDAAGLIRMVASARWVCDRVRDRVNFPEEERVELLATLMRLSNEKEGVGSRREQEAYVEWLCMYIAEVREIMDVQTATQVRQDGYESDSEVDRGYRA